jgi:hypothetical protein
MMLQPEFVVLRNPDGSIGIQAYARRAARLRRLAKRRSMNRLAYIVQCSVGRMIGGLALRVRLVRPASSRSA